MSAHAATHVGSREAHDPYAGIGDLLPEIWRGTERALCADPQHNAEWWFPNSEASNWEQAARICSHCPLLHACREWGIAHTEAGVWGGLTEQRRTRIRHERERAA